MNAKLSTNCLSYSVKKELGLVNPKHSLTLTSSFCILLSASDVEHGGVSFRTYEEESKWFDKLWKRVRPRLTGL